MCWADLRGWLVASRDIRRATSNGDTRMALLAPPPPSLPTALGDNDGLRRLRLRLLQILATAITVLVTAWLCTLGAIPAILGLMVAKHVLVAILVMGLGVDAVRPEIEAR